MKKKVVARGLADYIRKIVALKPIQDYSLNEQSLVYRGLSNVSYSLTPSIGRKVSPYWFNTIQTKEEEQINQAQQRFPNLFLNTDWPAIRLAKLQHYGIPTRMMDVTSNALVALYFACQKDAENADGEVVAFSGYINSGYNPIANAIADTARLGGNIYGNYNYYYYRVTKQPYFNGNIYPDNCDIKKAEKRFREVTGFPVIIDVGDVSTRQINQQGKFILFPNKPFYDDKTGEWMTQEELITLARTDKMIVKEIIIPGDIKKRIIKDLEAVGITEQFLFADNVDLVCKRIVDKQKEAYFRILEEDNP